MVRGSGPLAAGAGRSSSLRLSWRSTRSAQRSAPERDIRAAHVAGRSRIRSESCTLGIDPGNHSGWAVLDSRLELLDHGELRFDRVKQPSPSSIVKTLSCRYNLHVACIETQYLGESAHATIVLAQNAGRWIEACVSVDIPVLTMIAPSTWQAAELGCRSATKRSDRKKMSISRCLGLWRVTLSDHCADAALIARWAAVESQHGGSLA